MVSFNQLSISNVEYPILNTEGKYRVCLRVEFSVKFGTVILQKSKDFIIRHSLLNIGYSVTVT
jgi:hypothetical protein